MRFGCQQVFFYGFIAGINFTSEEAEVRDKPEWRKRSEGQTGEGRCKQGRQRRHAQFMVVHLDGDGHIATPWQHPSPWWNAHPSPERSWTDTDVHLSIFVTFSDRTDSYGYPLGCDWSANEIIS